MEFFCSSCNAPLTELVKQSKNGVVICNYCGAPRTIPKKETSPAALSFLRMGEHDLDTCKFEDALSAYQKAAELDKEEPEAYFGMALATYKVQYLKDEVRGCLQPICHEISENVFTDDGNYRKALQLATSEQKRIYRERAMEIDTIRDEFYSLQKSGLDYDCFLCVKVTSEDGSNTQDSHEALRLYHYLKEKGYTPFYSEAIMGERMGSDYEAHILYALYTSECMLIVCSDEEYLKTKWVKNEYTRFSAMIANEEKERDAVTFVYRGKPIEKLPGRNGKLQGIDLAKPTAYAAIADYVERHTPKARARREAEKARRNAEAEARAREFEEMKRRLEESEQRRIQEEEARKKEEQARAQANEEKRKAEEEARNRELSELKEKLAQMERERASAASPANLSPAELLAMMRKAEEDEKRRAEEEKRRAEEEARRKVEEEKRRAEEEARRKAEEERRRIEEEARKAEEEKRRAEEEARRKEEEEKQRLEEERKRREERERKRREERERIRREEEKRRAYLSQFDIADGVLIKYKGTESEVVIPDGVTSIKYTAFDYCKAKKITIPGSVKDIDEAYSWFFRECKNLQRIEVAEDNPKYSSQDGILYNKEKTKVIFVPEAIKGSITIPDSLFELNSRILFSLGLTEIKIGADNPKYCCEDRIIYNKNKTELVGTSPAIKGELTIPDSVTSIKDYAFCFRSGLTKVVIPNRVTKINNSTFSSCDGLKEVVIPKSVASIGEEAFQGCESLTKVTIPIGVTSIGREAFSECKLAQITIPDHMVSIGDKAFSHCNSLTRVTIPKRFKGFMNGGLKKIFGDRWKEIQFTFTD